MRSNKKYQQKLVRDLIPTIMDKKRIPCKIKILNKKQFDKYLREKLMEETQEALDSSKKMLIYELADIIEVIKALAENNNFSFSDIEEQRLKKAKEKGVFKKRLMLTWVLDEK